MSTELAVLNNQNNLALANQGGLGVDFNDDLFRLKPVTLVINQPSTQAENAIKGKLRIVETGDQFDEMIVTLLVKPVKQRAFYIGEAGTLNRTPENKVCFTRQVVKNEKGYDVSVPDLKSSIPQAARCFGCPKNDWSKWQENKVKENIPPCEDYYLALLIDTMYNMPLKMYLRSTAKKPFESAMANLARKIAMMKAQNLNPNIFDISFKLSTEKVQKGNTTSWIPRFTDFKVISEEQKAEFGQMYLSYTQQGAQEDAEEAAQEQIQTASQTIDSEVVGGTADAPIGI